MKHWNIQIKKYEKLGWILISIINFEMWNGKSELWVLK